MKAILLIDMPKNCVECPCCYGYYCPHLEREMGLWAIRTGKPVDCPLKPMPQKKEIHNENGYYDLSQLFYEGWNACLEAITGETE